jgi:hypothetical protein
MRCKFHEAFYVLLLQVHRMMLETNRRFTLEMDSDVRDPKFVTV